MRCMFYRSLTNDGHVTVTLEKYVFLHVFEKKRANEMTKRTNQADGEAMYMQNRRPKIERTVRVKQ